MKSPTSYAKIQVPKTPAKSAASQNVKPVVGKISPIKNPAVKATGKKK